MTDTADGEPVHVTAEERPHPALQKLARALIALARWRRDEEQAVEERPSQDSPPPSHGGGMEGVCHG
jgi:hypothetical protein